MLKKKESIKISKMKKFSDEDQIMMETLYWWGIPTLFRCKNDPDPKNCDIALVGVPHSTGNGTTERDQHLGPRAVRNVSAAFKRVHFDFSFNPWEAKKIHDLGDVPLPEANNNEKCIDQITNYFSLIANSGKPVVSIGGDHSITGGIIQGLANKNSALTKGKKISLLHIDAHTDTYHQLDQVAETQTRTMAKQLAQHLDSLILGPKSVRIET